MINSHCKACLFYYQCDPFNHEEKGVKQMDDKKKKVFEKPELIKFDKPLDEVTLWQCGTGCNTVCGGGWPTWMGPPPG
jgi:hypothetical protein